MLCILDRVELTLLEVPAFLREPGQQGDSSASLLLGADPLLPSPDLETRRQVEIALRARVERRYARQGITPVNYDLLLVEQAPMP